METTISTNVSPADLRELAFRDLEHSLATLRKSTEHLNRNSPLVRHMIGAIMNAESAVKIIVMTSGDEIKALPGPRHGEDVADFDAGGAVPIEATTVSTNSNGDGHDSNGNGATATDAQDAEKSEGPAPYAVAHAQVRNQCEARSLGCTRKRINGNSNGRHQQLCPFFQTGRLLEAGYEIDTVEDYVKALKKEYGKLPYKSVENMKNKIDLEHGSYRKVLLSVRRGLKARNGSKTTKKAAKTKAS